MELFLGDKDNQILIKAIVILPYATWETFAKRADVEKFMQSTAPASLSIRDLIR